MPSIVLIGFLFFILYLGKKQKDYFQMEYKLYENYNNFRKSFKAFLSLPPFEQQNFLDELTEKEQPSFLYMIENERMIPSSQKEIELMNRFILWANQNKVCILSPLEFQITVAFPSLKM